MDAQTNTPDPFTLPSPDSIEAKVLLLLRDFTGQCRASDIGLHRNLPRLAAAMRNLVRLGWPMNLHAAACGRIAFDSISNASYEAQKFLLGCRCDDWVAAADAAVAR